VPLAANLGAGELAINYTDGKLFYKDNSAAIQVIGWKTTPTTAGGTGLTSYTAGDLPYYASGTALSKLGIGTANYVLTSSGTAPQYVAQSTLSVGSATNATNTAITDNTSSSATWYPTIVSATTGNLPQTTSSTKLSFVPSTGTLTATSYAGAWAGSTISTTYGGTGLTSFTANGVVYASSTSALATSPNLTFNGTTLSTFNDMSIHGLNIGLGGGSVATNTAFGYGALGSATSSSSTNTCVGYNAGGNITSGQYNTCVGFYAGVSLFNITTQNGRLVLGSTDITNAYVNVAWTVVSDARDKTDIQDSPYGLNFINDLRAVIYKWDKRDKYQNGIPDGTHKETKTQIGFLSQDVIAIEKKYGAVAGNLLIADDEEIDNLKITETKMIPTIVKSIQELSLEITSLKQMLKTAGISGF